MSSDFRSDWDSFEDQLDQTENLSLMNKELGKVPELIKNLASAPDIMEIFLELRRKLMYHSELTQEEYEQICVYISARNKCNYCLAAHSFLGYESGIDGQEICLNKNGQSSSPRTAAILGFIRELLENDGCVSQRTSDNLEKKGISRQCQLHIIGAVGVITFVNYAAEVTRPELDFPQFDFEKGEVIHH